MIERLFSVVYEDGRVGSFRVTRAGFDKHALEAADTLAAKAGSKVATYVDLGPLTTQQETASDHAAH